MKLSLLAKPKPATVCGFEIWDGHSMVKCGKIVVARCGKHHVCSEHAKYVFELYHWLVDEKDQPIQGKQAREVMRKL